MGFPSPNQKHTTAQHSKPAPVPKSTEALTNKQRVPRKSPRCTVKINSAIEHDEQPYHPLPPPPPPPPPMTSKPIIPRPPREVASSTVPVPPAKPTNPRPRYRHEYFYKLVEKVPLHAPIT